MKHKIQNHHDKIVKETFLRPELAKEYFKQFLPAGLKNVIDMDTMTKLETSYIQEGLEEYFSDLVFQFKVKGTEKELCVSLLFEHKSHRHKHVHVQLGHYIFSQWVKELKERTVVVPIIPFIYYQGKSKWKVLKLQDMFSDYPDEIKKYIPTFDFVFMALNAVSKKTLDAITDAMLIIALTGHNRNIGIKEFVQKLNNILKLKSFDDIDGNFISHIIVYKTREDLIEKEEFIELIKTIPNPVNDNIMSLYDAIKIEGKIEEKIETVLTLNEDKLPLEQIAKYARLTMNEVRKILKDNGKLLKDNAK
ncbi:MAG: Rpn family recombination-promoting nuclease/putative transposase [Saprospiraceae bacterium]|jgi:predicted transposase/invertase (TIGR01784 family)|nr:Rpn family recombination-promoting nuclease/putative transposase [Saprospiraceae bacterium]